MNDFAELDAFQLCRDFARTIAVPLNGGLFARDPVLVAQCLGGLMRHLNTSEMRGRNFKFRDERKR